MNKLVRESLNFERTGNVKSGLGIGKYSKLEEVEEAFQKLYSIPGVGAVNLNYTDSTKSKLHLVIQYFMPGGIPYQVITEFDDNFFDKSSFKIVYESEWNSTSTIDINPSYYDLFEKYWIKKWGIAPTVH